MSPSIQNILSWYGSDNPGTLTHLARLLNHGRLAGTRNLVILRSIRALNMAQPAALRPIRLPTIRATAGDRVWL